jgi:hypothetical protein
MELRDLIDVVNLTELKGNETRGYLTVSSLYKL